MNQSRVGWAAVALLVIARGAYADPGAAPAEAPPVLDLATAKAIALQRQPAIAAARASLEAALARKRALDNLRVPTFLQRDLPIRRKQAALGPVAGQAGVLLAEMNTIYGVQYGYVTYLFARSQQQLADEALKGLGHLDDFLSKVVQALEKEPDFETEFLAADRERVRGMISLARARRAEAVSGAERALSALREAMGLEHGCPLVLAQDRLLDVHPDVCRGEMVELALSRRPEIVQAAVAEEAHQLEVAAQESRKLALTVRTFASGSDIHAQPLPAGSHGEHYVPGAVGPEMPSQLAGRKLDRAAVAAIYHDRSLSVVEKARKLIRLEVEQACLRYQGARARLPELEQGIAHAAKARSGLREALVIARGARGRAESFLNTALLASQLRVSANEARYEMLLALIALERDTAGAFCAGLDKAPQVPPPPEEKLGGLGSHLFKDKSAPKNR